MLPSTFLSAIGLAAVGLSMSFGAQAVLIDFEELADGPRSVPLVYPEATFTSASGEFIVNVGLGSKDLCAFFNGGCGGTLTVDFASPAGNLQFLSAGDNVSGLLGNASVYVTGIFTTDVAINYDGNGSTYDPVDLSSFSGITRVVLTSTDVGGVSWDNFSFSAAAIPEPQVYALMLAGMALLGAKAWRKRR